MRCSRDRPSRSSLGNHELIATATGDREGLLELGAAGELSGGVIDEDLLAAGGCERVVLGFGVLVAGGDPAVADAHALTVTLTPVCAT